MASVDLSKLRIERGSPAAVPSRGRGLRKMLLVGLVVAIAGAAAFLVYRRVAGAAAEVEQATVTLAYPYQAISVLNATGYVVAQRKASVASKATGRLEWLGVQEGSRVKKGEVIARLESLDVGAARDQAAANVNVAQANLEQAQAELREAKRAAEALPGAAGEELRVAGLARRGAGALRPRAGAVNSAQAAVRRRGGQPARGRGGGRADRHPRARSTAWC